MSCYQSDLLVVSCDLICDLPLHLLADLHRTHDATVTMLLSQLPDLTEVSVPGGKANKKLGMLCSTCQGYSSRGYSSQGYSLQHSYNNNH